MSINNVQGNTLLESGAFPPCRAAATAAIILSGLQTIDDVSLNAGDRVLVWQQPDQTTNGIYAASTGNWVRTTDAQSNTQFFNGMVAVIAGGATYAGVFFQCTCTDDPVVIGTSLLTFSALNNPGGVSQAMLPVVAAPSLSSARTQFGLKALATEGIGAALQDDGSGNARVNFAPVAVSANQDVTNQFHLQKYICTGDLAFSFPAGSTLWDGFGFWVYSPTGVTTLNLSGSDQFVAGTASSASLTVPAATWAYITTNAEAGLGGATWWIEQTLPASSINFVSGGNLLPNCDWQLFSTLIGSTSAVCKMNAAGTGLQTPIAVSSFTTSSPTPTLYTTNTQSLTDGDLVVFGAGQGGLSGWALRAFNVIANTSFQVNIPFSQATPASSTPLTASPMGIYEPGTSAFGPDGGWSKTVSLVMWADDIAGNACPGAKRVLGLRKGASNGEGFKWRPRTLAPILAVRGRRVSFGVLIRQKVGGGAAKIYLNDGVTVTYSSVLTGASFIDANYNNYQFLTVSAVIGATTSFLEVGFEFDGNAGDICYLALPTLKFGIGMTVNDLGQNPGEWLRADTHWNPPCLVPFGSGATPSQWPGAEIITGSGLYGWADIDIEALSYGQCHSSVSKVNSKVEYTSSQVGSICFVAALDIPDVQLTFGLQASVSVASATVSTNMSPVPLINGQSSAGSPPGCWSMFSNKLSGPITTITFDFDDVLC